MPVRSVLAFLDVSSVRSGALVPVSRLRNFALSHGLWGREYLSSHRLA